MSLNGRKLACHIGRRLTTQTNYKLKRFFSWRVSLFYSDLSKGLLLYDWRSFSSFLMFLVSILTFVKYSENIGGNPQWVFTVGGKPQAMRPQVELHSGLSVGVQSTVAWTHLSFPLKGFKQLKWEAERDDWLHNRDVKSIIKKKKNFKKKMKIPQKPRRQRKWELPSELRFYSPLVFALQPLFLIALSNSIYSRLFNGFVVNYRNKMLSFMKSCRGWTYIETLLPYCYVRKRTAGPMFTCELLTLRSWPLMFGTWGARLGRCGVVLFNS